MKDKIKYRAYCLLYDFQMKKESTLKPLNLPFYNVPLASIQPDKLSSSNKKAAIDSVAPIELKMHP